MPYVKQEKRMDMGPALAELADLITVAGDLNYVICRLAHTLAVRKGGNYAAFNEAVGAIECAKQEFYRRVIAPYEDVKIKENGDVF